MRIALEKQIAFLEQVIIDTKVGLVYWDSLASTSQAAIEAFPNKQLDREGVFEGTFSRDFEGHFLISMCEDNMVIGAVGTDYERMVLLSTENEEVEVLLIRLFNLICNRGPNASKVIDQYLKLRNLEDNGR